MGALTVNRVCMLCLTSLVTAAADIAAAAESSQPSAATVLEEIVVTAQRREENVQNIAIAITALTGDELKDKAVTRLDDLQFASPALTITDAGLSQSVNIRGVGLSSGSPQVTNGVATYVDGVFQPPIVTTSSFYDIGTVEVLRGPQGTFVGSSSTGGAIFINSRSPSLDGTEGYAQVSAGNYSSRGFEGAVNVPFGDTVAMRFAGIHRQRDSYYTDVGAFHNEPGKLDETAGRVGFLWKPGAFQALLKTELVNRETGGYAQRPTLGTNYAPLRSSDLRTLTYDDPTKNHERANQNTLEFRYELDNGVVLRSISGYQDKRIWNLYDTDASIQPALPPPNPYPRTSMDQFVRERIWAEEINIISPTNGAFDWILGGYWQRNRINVDITINSTANLPIDIDTANQKEITGFFAQVGYKFAPGWKLNVGARQSMFDVTSRGAIVLGRGTPFPPFNGTGLQIGDATGSHDDGRATGKVALEWTPSDGNLVYAFVARGYKPGGFNSATSEFDPETVLDYEMGWKATLLDGRLRTNIGGFWYDYSGFQLDVLDPTTGQVQTQNLADATIRGVEAQAQAQIGGWGFDIGVAYVDSELGEVQFVDQRALPPGINNLTQCAPGASPGTPPTCFDYNPYIRNANGGPLLFSPELTYNAGAEYTFDIGDATLRPRINYAYIGEQWTNLLYSAGRDRLAPRGLLSAQLTFQRHAWTLEAYGTNLSDKEYISGQGGNSEFYGPPREYGVRGTFRF
jgi:iron complex outermembrane receptor protein